MKPQCVDQSVFKALDTLRVNLMSKTSFLMCIQTLLHNNKFVKFWLNWSSKFQKNDAIKNTIFAHYQITNATDLKSFSIWVRNYLCETTILQWQPLLTMLYTINSSLLLVTQYTNLCPKQNARIRCSSEQKTNAKKKTYKTLINN